MNTAKQIKGDFDYEAAMTPEELLHLRESLGYTQQEFADKLKLSRTLISLMETGDKVISRATKVLIDKLLSHDEPGVNQKIMDLQKQLIESQAETLKIYREFQEYLKANK